jgi:hypothetical protein
MIDSFTETEQEMHARQTAMERIESSDLLKPYADIIMDDWPSDDTDWQWVATAPEMEIIQWADDIRDSKRGVIAIDDPISELEEDWD